MLNRRAALAAFAYAFVVASIPAAAGETTPFTARAFESALKAGKPVVVDVFAPWCPTCRAQAPILTSLRSRPEFKNVLFLDVNFDDQKDALRALNARQQSTLIVFKNGAEVGRSVGDTNRASIESLLSKAL